MIGSENLKKRIISAIVMVLIVLPLIVFGGLYLKIGTVVLGACSMYELLKQKNNMPLFIKIISVISVMLVIYFSNNFSIFSNLYFFPALFLLFFVPVVFIDNKEKYNLVAINEKIILPQEVQTGEIEIIGEYIYKIAIANEMTNY